MSALNGLHDGAELSPLRHFAVLLVRQRSACCCGPGGAACGRAMDCEALLPHTLRISFAWCCSTRQRSVPSADCRPRDLVLRPDHRLRQVGLTSLAARHVSGDPGGVPAQPADAHRAARAGGRHHTRRLPAPGDRRARLLVNIVKKNVGRALVPGNMTPSRSIRSVGARPMAACRRGTPPRYSQYSGVAVAMAARAGGDHALAIVASLRRGLDGAFSERRAGRRGDRQRRRAHGGVISRCGGWRSRSGPDDAVEALAGPSARRLKAIPAAFSPPREGAMNPSEIRPSPWWCRCATRPAMSRRWWRKSPVRSTRNGRWRWSMWMFLCLYFVQFYVGFALEFWLRNVEFQRTRSDPARRRTGKHQARAQQNSAR